MTEAAIMVTDIRLRMIQDIHHRRECVGEAANMSRTSYWRIAIGKLSLGDQVTMVGSKGV